MSDLHYIFNMGFSGADIWRAIAIAFLLGMYASKRRSIWLMAFWALIIDRIIWPLAGQAMAGAQLQSIYGSLGGIAYSFLDNLGLYLVRYLGIAGLMFVFVHARRRLHAGFQTET